MTGGIRAGSESQITWGDGNWVFLDIGFASRKPTCGFAQRKENPELLTFAEAQKRVIEAIERSTLPLNLVIEAPLSVCFDTKGNPKRRKIEVENQKHRYWYSGPGCTVMVASIYLIRSIHCAVHDASVRLFEGFISFKDHSVPSDGREDVRKLREVVCDPSAFPGCVYTAQQLKEDDNDNLISAFCVAGLDCGVPAVIKRQV